MLTIASIETNFIAWAQAQEDLRAAIVVGSQARRDHPADEWSDIDLILFVTDIERRQTNISWLAEIGPLWLSQAGRTVSGDPERLALYAGGVQVDFVFNPIGALDALPQMLAAGQIPDIIHRGVRVLLDKDGRIPSLPEPGPLPAAKPPSADEFRQTLESFWFSAVYCAKQLRRGELLLFQNASAGMTWPLLRMIEWHARTIHGWDYDTWHAGKFIAEWADAPVYAALQDCFAHLDAADGGRVMAARLKLFHKLSRQVAEKMAFSYPAALEADIVQIS